MKPHCDIVCTQLTKGNKFWLELRLKAKHVFPDTVQRYGPFDSEAECEAKAQEIMKAVYEVGKKDKIPILRSDV